MVAISAANKMRVLLWQAQSQNDNQKILRSRTNNDKNTGILHFVQDDDLRTGNGVEQATAETSNDVMRGFFATLRMTVFFC
jgi:hypothetical protein